LINAGTDSEEIGLLLRPRKPCYLDHWSGWLQVTHGILYSDESKTDVKPIEKHLLWMYPAEDSGLWFPPGRVLVCDDKLDLAIYMNDTDVAGRFAVIEEENAAALGRSQDIRFPHRSGSSFRDVLEKAGRSLHGTVDTLVFLNHIDLTAPYGHMRRLITEYVLLPSSHSLRPIGCPVSSALRMDANYAPAHGKPGVSVTDDEDPMARIKHRASGPKRNLSYGQILDALSLAPCNCSASVSNVC